MITMSLDNPVMPARDVVELVKLFDLHQLMVVLDGGWG